MGVVKFLHARPRFRRGEFSSHTPAIQARRNIAVTCPFLILSFFYSFVKLFRKRRKETPHKSADCALCGIALREGFRVKALPQRFVPFYFFFFSWQAPAMAQCAQLQPHDDFPRRLSRISEKTISPTTTTSAAQISTVGRYFATQNNIAETPFTIFTADYFVTLTSVVSLVASL